MNRLSCSHRIAIAVFAMLLSGASAAQDYPTKPIRFVLGPALDLLPRIIGQRLTETWGQQVVIDQRPGAAGIIAADLVAKSPPDGYTWLLGAASYVAISSLYPKLPYNFERDFAPVTLMGTLPFIVVVHPSVPVKSLADLIQLARAQPGKLNFASAGNGTSTQIAAEMFNSVAKIKTVHVPYKGVAPGVTAVLGGEVQLMFGIAQSVVPHVHTGKLRALAITSTKRSPAVPDVPTMAEAGYAEVDVVGWNAIHVPAKTPAAIIQKINAEVNRLIKFPEMNERMIAAGFEPAITTVAEFDAFVKKDFNKYAKVIKEAKIRVD
jgi:tripartite-type tricarboxylate transporter receptor subunit TctC